MSVEKIVAMAAEGNALKLKEAFEEEVNARIAAALEEKYKKMTKESEDKDEDDDEDEDEHDEKEKDEDEDEDDDKEDMKEKMVNPGLAKHAAKKK
jgi:hypothetical protein